MSSTLIVLIVGFFYVLCCCCFRVVSVVGKGKKSSLNEMFREFG